MIKADASLDEIGDEIDKTIRQLGRLQALYAAAQKDEHERVEKLVREYRRAQQEEAKRVQAEEDLVLEMSNT